MPVIAGPLAYFHFDPQSNQPEIVIKTAAIQHKFQPVDPGFF